MFSLSSFLLIFQKVPHFFSLSEGRGSYLDRRFLGFSWKVIWVCKASGHCYLRGGGVQGKLWKEKNCGIAWRYTEIMFVSHVFSQSSTTPTLASQLRIVAWFEELSGGPVISVSFEKFVPSPKKQAKLVQGRLLLDTCQGRVTDLVWLTLSSLFK